MIACFDVGGTYIKCGIFDFKEYIIQSNLIKTPKQNCKNAIPNIIVKIVNSWKKEYKIKGVGVCTAGTVDREKGEVIFSTEIADYSGAKIVELVELGTGLPCIIENDVNGAALGERYKGIGRDYNNFICMMIGTGLGSAFFIDGKLHRGSNGLAGEIGHMSIDINGKDCNCGDKGCFARYGSTNALISKYRGIVGEEEIDGKFIMDKVKNRDKIALKVLDSYMKELSIGFANIIHIFDPEIIIVGGGITRSGDDFLNPLREMVEIRLIPSFKGKIKIETTKLGNEAALIGIGFEMNRFLKEM